MNFHRIAVTGPGGQLGSALRAHLGPRALPVDRSTLPLDRPDAVGPALQTLRPDAIINCGAYVAVDKAEQESELCFRTNAETPAAMAEACARLDIPLVQISTDYVYCRSERREPHREVDPISPDGVYARSKAAGEQAALKAPRSLVVRTCGLYGVTPRKANFVETMLRLGGEGRRLRVVDDQTCTPSHVADVARAVVHLLDREATGIVNVTNRGFVTWFDFANEIFRQSEMHVEVEPITSAQFGAPAPRPAYSVLDCGLYESLGGPPLPFWQEALAAYLSARTQPESSAP
ncbi:MAG TPA: dTDP-4-dehydrorhamnose reductase [Pirellulaceae bacterium]|jgi:dTDP-4-dehydrorhamnose reductase|nr:dTDP-4-dehydrorhamnose reductase [Pirellulaceae bacterium]